MNKKSIEEQKAEIIEEKKSKIKARIDNLTHHTDEAKEDIVEKSLSIADLDLNSLFNKTEERKLAKDLAKKYLEEFIPKTVSDKQNLRSVIYLEVVQVRLQAVMNNLCDQSDKAIPLNLIDSIHKNLKEIASCKVRLGLVGKEKDAHTSDAYNYIQTLKTKFAQWCKENPLSRTFVCPACGDSILLKLRMDKWDAQKHPFFEDRFLANKHIIRLYLENKLTKEDVAKILETSTDYIEDLIEKMWVNSPAYREIIEKYRTMDKAKPTVLEADVVIPETPTPDGLDLASTLPEALNKELNNEAS